MTEMKEAGRGNGGAQVKTESGTRLDGSPVEILRRLGVTKEGNPLEAAYMDSWREQSRLANEGRPLQNKLLHRNKVTAEAIARAELKGMVGRATEVVTSQGVEATEEAIRQAIPEIAADFRPKTIPELRAEASVQKAEEQFKKAVEAGKWRRAAKTIRKTQKQLATNEETLESFLSRISDSLHGRLARAVEVKEGTRFFKALRTFDKVLVGDHHIDVTRLPGVTPQMLEEKDFWGTIENDLAFDLQHEFLTTYKKDRQILLNAKIEPSMIDESPRIQGTVLQSLVDHLKYGGPESFSRHASNYLEVGIDTKYVAESEEAAEIARENLVGNLKYGGPESFARRQKEFHQAGIDTAHVVASDEVEAITSENLLGRLRYGGAGSFDRGVKEFKEAGLSTESVSQSSEAIAIVKEKLLGDLQYSSPEDFASKAEEFVRAGLDIAHVLNSREAQEIVTEKLFADLRYSSPDHVAHRVQAFQEAGLDITPFLQSEEARKIVHEKIDSAVRYSSPASATGMIEEYSALGFSYTFSDLTRDVR